MPLLAEENTNSEIAKQLVISQKTADKHRSAVMERVDIHCLTGLRKEVIKSGLIALDEYFHPKQ